MSEQDGVRVTVDTRQADRALARVREQLDELAASGAVDQ